MTLHEEFWEEWHQWQQRFIEAGWVTKAQLQELLDESYETGYNQGYQDGLDATDKSKVD